MSKFIYQNGNELYYGPRYGDVDYESPEERQFRIEFYGLDHVLKADKIKESRRSKMKQHQYIPGYLDHDVLGIGEEW